MMKRCLLLCCLLLIALTQASGQAAGGDDYRKHPLPSFGIRLIEDQYYNTASVQQGKPTIFILFSTDCHHCSAVARELRDSLGAFEGCNLFFISPPMPFADIQKFARVHGLVQQPGLRVGQDTAFFFGSFYHAGTVPFVVMYDRKKKWFKTLESMNHLTELLSELRQMQSAHR